jgi:hypothetical protein
MEVCELLNQMNSVCGIGDTSAYPCDPVFHGFSRKSPEYLLH